MNSNFEIDSFQFHFFSRKKLSLNVPNPDFKVENEAFAGSYFDSNKVEIRV